VGSLQTLRQAVGILGVLLVAISAWLLLPRPAAGADESRSPVRVCIVDASASARRTRPGWLPWVRRALESEAREAEAAGQLFAVVSFAAQVGTSFPVEPPSVFLERLRGSGGRLFDPVATAGGDGASELARAVEVACELGGTATRRLEHLVILGAGTYTGGDPHPAVARARRLGAGVTVRGLQESELTDLAVRELRLPQTIEAGAPLVGRVRLDLRRGTVPVQRAWLEVEIENAGEIQALKRPLDLPAAGGEFELELACGTAGFGRTEVRVRCRMAPGPDPVPENDRVRGACTAAGEIVVGVVADGNRMAAARAWLAPSGTSALPGLQFVFLAPDELHGVLYDLDVLVSFDLRLRDLPELLVEDFLLQSGGGWLATSGWRFLEDWVPGQVQRGLGRLLPLEPAPLDRGPRDVVLLVDGSGSMEGQPFETVRAACLDLVAAALPSDEVSLRFFTGRLEEARSIKPRTEGADRDQERVESVAKRLVDLRVPTGATQILTSLEQFAETRRATDNEALVLLLTDGREREAMANPEERARKLLATLADVHAELRVIAVGKDADLNFLRYLTRPGEDVARPESLEDLRALFRREISGAQWRGGDALTLRWVSADDSLATESIATRIRGVGTPPPIRPVERLVKNVVRPRAETVWVDDEGEPVLGIQRVGLGRTALVGSHPGAGWAPAWGGRFGRGEPAAFGALLRWLGRGTRRRDDGPDLELLPGAAGARLVLAGLDDSWPASVEGRLLDSRSGAELARLVFTPPATSLPTGGSATAGTIDRREARLDGALLARLSAAQALFWVERPADRGFWLAPLWPGPAAEFAGREASLDLRELLDLGPVLGPDRAGRGQEPHPWAPEILLAGLVLLLGAAVVPRRGPRTGQAIGRSDR